MQRMSKDRHRAAMSGNGKATSGNVTRGLSNVCEKFFDVCWVLKIRKKTFALHNVLIPHIFPNLPEHFS